MTVVMGRLIVPFVRVIFVLALFLHLILSIGAIHGNLGILLLTIRRTPVEIGNFLSIVIASVAPVAAAMTLIVFLPNIGKKSPLIHVLAALATICYTVSAILLSYRIKTGLAADPFLLGYHFDDALRTVSVLSSGQAFPIAIIVVTVLCFYYGLVDLFRYAVRVLAAGNVTRRFKTPKLVAIAALAGLITTQFYVDNGIGSLLLEFREPRSEAKTLYVHFFKDSVLQNTRQRPALGMNTAGENLFFIHLESLNAELVNSNITPRLVEVAERNGIWFPKIQASSVFTILAMESILCSVLPTLSENLAQSKPLFGRLNCLPRIMGQMGYRTFYFQNFANLDFNNMGPFLRAIGFHEQQGGDIFKPGDQLLKWGLPEDIFYDRVFGYLNKFKNERIFVYILIGATNHYPFYSDETRTAYPHLLNRLPFQNPVRIKERLANTTFIQDHSFGRMYDRLFSPNYAENSHMVVFGDHSWPIEIHRGNNHNLNGAFQENFVSALAILPAKRTQALSRYAVGKEVKSLYSHIDIMPTVLDMYGVRPHNFYGSSFFEELAGRSALRKRNRCVVSTQPFSGGAIALVDYPKKYIFDLKRGIVTNYDLGQDPNEMNPTDITQVDSDRMGILKHCLMSIRDKQPLSAMR